MSLNDFKVIVKSLRDLDKFIEKLDKLNIDISETEIFETVGLLADCLWKEAFGIKGADLFNEWYFDGQHFDSPTDAYKYISQCSKD